MKALPTQFDDRSLSSAVATPTCGGCCCCCCCCLATTITSTSLLTQRIAKDTKTNNIANSGWLIALAVLIWPITTLVSGMVNYIGDLISTNLLIFQHTPILGVLTTFVLLLLVLRYLYGQVHVNKPLKRAILVTVLISVAFVLEFFGGAFLILTGFGGIVTTISPDGDIDMFTILGLYIIIAVAVAVWVSIWYYRRYNKKIAAIGQPMQMTSPEVQLTENHVENSTKPDETTPTPQEPPQPNPPTPSSQ